MKIVVDSNIVFSALISGKEIYVDIFKINDVFIPDIVFSELNKYEVRLIKKTKLKRNEFRTFVQMLFEEITVIPKFAISPENWQMDSTENSSYVKIKTIKTLWFYQKALNNHGG